MARLRKRLGPPERSLTTVLFTDNRAVHRRDIRREALPGRRAIR